MVIHFIDIAMTFQQNHHKAGTSSKRISQQNVTFATWL